MKLTVQLLLPLSILSMSACSLENKTDSGDITDTAENLDTADDTGESTDTGSDTGTSEPDPLEEETCDLGTIEAPPSGECAYTTGSENGLLLVGTILEPNKVTDNGGVYIDEDGIIQCVGCSCLTDHLDVPRIVCDDASISPGLINAHDHMGWMGGEPYVATEAGEDPCCVTNIVMIGEKEKESPQNIQKQGRASRSQESKMGRNALLSGWNDEYQRLW